jgi:hypothetical protein
MVFTRFDTSWQNASAMAVDAEAVEKPDPHNGLVGFVQIKDDSHASIRPPAGLDLPGVGTSVGGETSPST